MAALSQEDRPSARYQYTPLAKRDDIRLLQLHPDPQKDNPINCSLFPYSPPFRAHHGTDLYEALSYVWGDPSHGREILVDGYQVKITLNLHAALSHLRHPILPRLLWVDALCIDQDNDDEKGEQVASMASIYGGASRVIVWLGEEEAGSGEAVEAIRIAGTQNYSALRRASTSPPALASGRFQAADSAHTAAVMALLKRSWFERIWVLQEVAAAHHTLVKCGRAEIDGQTFCAGLNALNLMDLFTKEPDLHSKVLTASYLIGEPSFRPSLPTSHPNERHLLGIRPLAELVDMYHSRKATDIRDKFFALLGMSSDNYWPATGVIRMTANYKASWGDIFKQFIHAFLSWGPDVKAFPDDEFAVVRTEIQVMGHVSKLAQGASKEGRQTVEVRWNLPFDSPAQRFEQYNIPVGVKAIEPGDMVCSLNGASSLAVVGFRGDAGLLNIIRCSLSIELPGAFDGHRNWKRLLPYDNEVGLIWDWALDDQADRSSKIVQTCGARSLLSSPRWVHPVLQLELLRFHRPGAPTNLETLDRLKDNLSESVKAWDMALKSAQVRSALSSGPVERDPTVPVWGLFSEFVREFGKWEIMCLAAAGGHSAVIGELVNHSSGEWPQDGLYQWVAMWIASRTGHELAERTLRQSLPPDTLTALQHDSDLRSKLGFLPVRPAIVDNNLVVIKVITDTVAMARHTADPLDVKKWDLEMKEALWWLGKFGASGQPSLTRQLIRQALRRCYGAVDNWRAGGKPLGELSTWPGRLDNG